MRMSGLCKVEMSGFIQGGRADGTGANRVECERTGSAEGVARSRARPSETGGSGAASAIERTAGPALAGPAASGRRWRDRAWAARSPLEPEDSRDLCAARVARLAPGALSGIRPHAGRRAPGAPGPLGQPRDAAAVDEHGRLVAPAKPAGESRPCVAATTGLGKISALRWRAPLPPVPP